MAKNYRVTGGASGKLTTPKAERMNTLQAVWRIWLGERVMACWRSGTPGAVRAVAGPTAMGNPGGIGLIWLGDRTMACSRPCVGVAMLG